MAMSIRYQAGSSAALVPAGTRDNIINRRSGPMKLDTLDASPNHRDGVVDATKRTQRQTKNTSTGRRPNSHLPYKSSGGLRPSLGRQNAHWHRDQRRPKQYFHREEVEKIPIHGEEVQCSVRC